MEGQEVRYSYITDTEYAQQLPSKKNQVKAILIGLIQGCFIPIGFLMIVQSYILIGESHLILRSLLWLIGGLVLLTFLAMLTRIETMPIYKVDSSEYYNFGGSNPVAFLIGLGLITTIFLHPVINIVFDAGCNWPQPLELSSAPAYCHERLSSLTNNS